MPLFGELLGFLNVAFGWFTVKDGLKDEVLLHFDPVEVGQGV